MASAPEQYAIYLRKSRADDPNATIEETLARHEKMLLETAARLRLNVVKTFREVVSGESIAGRPQMQQLLSEVEQGIYAGVLVVEIERLARGNSIDQGIIAQCFQITDTKIVTPHKTINPNDEFDSEALEFGLFMSRREYKTINRRLQRGREMSVREGKYVGNIPPYGYRREKVSGDKGYTLVPDPEEAKAVRLVYAWFLDDRLGVTDIRNKLNALRVPTRKGGDWTDVSVRDILTNPVYAGKIRWGGRAQVKKVVAGEVVRTRPRADNPIVVDGRHEAIVTEEAFEKVQEVFARNSAPPVPKGRQLQNPLAGIVVCGVCGRKMIRRPYLKKGLPPTLMCPGPTCTNVSSHLSLVEERLLSALAEWLKRYRLAAAEEKAPAPEADLEAATRRQAVHRIDSEISASQGQMDRLHDLLEQGVYTVEVFMARQKALNERLAALRADRDALEKEGRSSSSRAESDVALMPKVERIIDLYRGLPSAAEKNALLREVVEKAVYTKPPANRGKEDAFDLVIYPRLPR